MAQRLYMILLEDDPADPGFSLFEEELRHDLSDSWDNCGYSAFEVVTDVEEDDEQRDGFGPLQDVLYELREKIAERKNGN